MHQQNMSVSSRTFFRALSHQLRSPLMRIRFAVELARESVNVTPQLHRVDSEVNNIEQILQDCELLLEEASEFETQVPLSLSRVNLPDFIAQLNTELASRLTAKNISLIWPAGAPFEQMIVLELFHPLVQRLIRQAMRYSESGSTIVMSWENTQTGWQFAVTDSGLTLAEEYFSRLFDTFYVGPGGRGSDDLGLPLAAHLALQQQAHLTVNASSEGGLAITVQMPTTP